MSAGVSFRPKTEPHVEPGTSDLDMVAQRADQLGVDPELAAHMMGGHETIPPEGPSPADADRSAPQSPPGGPEVGGPDVGAPDTPRALPRGDNPDIGSGETEARSSGGTAVSTLAEDDSGSGAGSGAGTDTGAPAEEVGNRAGFSQDELDYLNQFFDLSSRHPPTQRRIHRGRRTFRGRLRGRRGKDNSYQSCLD